MKRLLIALLFIAAALSSLRAAAPDLPAAPPTAPPPPVPKPVPFHALVFTQTGGFYHDSIPSGVAALFQMAHENGFEVDATSDAAAFTDANLRRFQVLIFLNTTGDILNARQKAALQKFIRRGGGYVGVHAASDTEHGWDWYKKLVGAEFVTHPRPQEAVIHVEDRSHPATMMLPAEWKRFEEWYAFSANPRPNVHVLASVDEKTYEGGTMGADHPFIWCHEFDGGRAFYTGCGHHKESYAEPLFLQSLLGGIRWAAGAAPWKEPDKTPG